jgi:hypothetical protein
MAGPKARPVRGLQHAAARGQNSEPPRGARTLLEAYDARVKRENFSDALGGRCCGGAPAAAGDLDSRINCARVRVDTVIRLEDRAWAGR